ncbi:MAG: hypothetical protein WC663_00435 [Patescibacteria group bacterium]|jgi:hypothetical protein
MRWKAHLVRLFSCTTYENLKKVDLSQVRDEDIESEFFETDYSTGFYFKFAIGKTRYEAGMHTHDNELDLEIEERPEGQACGNYGEPMTYRQNHRKAYELYAEVMSHSNLWKLYLRRIFKFSTMIDCSTIDLDSFEHRNVIPVITNTGFQLHFTCQSQRGFEPYCFGLYEKNGCLFLEAQDKNGKHDCQIRVNRSEAQQIYDEIIDNLTTP